MDTIVYVLSYPQGSWWINSLAGFFHDTYEIYDHFTFTGWVANPYRVTWVGDSYATFRNYSCPEWATWLRDWWSNKHQYIANPSFSKILQHHSGPIIGHPKSTHREGHENYIYPTSNSIQSQFEARDVHFRGGMDFIWVFPTESTINLHVLD